jgi:hypothetical protein
MFSIKYWNGINNKYLPKGVLYTILHYNDVAIIYYIILDSLWILVTCELKVKLMLITLPLFAKIIKCYQTKSNGI